MQTARKTRSGEILLLIIIVLCGWFALVAQMKINIGSEAAPLPELLVRYFSYFTLLTNLIVALVCTSVLCFPDSALGKFAAGYTTQTAVTTYILIVGIVYNVVLRPLWKPTGLQKPVDELLHTVIPLLFLLHWILFVPKNQLPYKAILPWLLYPLIYVIFVLIRGSFSGFYPYPFLDLGKLSIPDVFVNATGIAVAVVVVSATLILIGNRSAIQRESTYDSLSNS
ncbi:Pr6Pr family membrane protein [Flavitalea antarctica]